MESVQITPEQAAAAVAAKDAHAAPAAAERPAHIPEKFWKDGKADYEGLAKSYTELEKLQSAAPKAEATKQGETPAPQAVPIPGVTAENSLKYTQEFTKDGKLSDTSYADLAKAGYSKSVVDAYIKGLTADQTQAQAVQGAVVAAKEIDAIKSSIGGDEQLAAMLNWAKAGLTPAELKEYNDAVTSTDVAKVKMAVNGLHALYTKENGKRPNLLGGQPPNGGPMEFYASKEEMAEDMASEKYRRDPAFRAKVARKLGNSKII